jgi:membrane protein
MHIFRTLYQDAHSWNADRGSFLGAALAYYALFSIAPLLIIAIASIGLFVGEAEIKLKIIGMAQDNIGKDGAEAVMALVDKLWQPQTTLWASILGPIILMLTASNFFLQLGTALEMIWNLKSQQHKHWLYAMIMNYLLSFVMVVLSGAFWLTLFLGDGVLTYFLNIVEDLLPGGKQVWFWGHTVLYILLTTGMLLFTFRFLSHARIPYRDLWLGALVASALFFLGRLLFIWYLTYMGKSLATAFGAASSIVIFLIWVYYSAQIIFFGAEVVKVNRQPPIEPSANIK